MAGGVGVGAGAGTLVGAGAAVWPGGWPAAMVNERVAGTGSGPAALTARTWNVCPPGASAGVVYGEAQGANGASFIRHSKLTPGSVAVNVNCAAAPSTVSDSIAVSGATGSPCA